VSTVVPSNADLVREVQRLLPNAITPALSPSSKGNDLFEAFLFMLVLDAATSIGATIRYEDPYETTTRTLTLRTSPGRIYTTSPPYTHAVLRFDGADPLEAHVGIYVSGRSTVAHECDVAVIHKAEAQRARAEGVHPRSSKARFTVEAKFYATPLGIALAREFTGLRSDLSAQTSLFVTNTTAENVARLLSHRCPVESYHPHVLPQSEAAADFRSTARKALQRYVSQ
jgi:hypothetical protein